MAGIEEREDISPIEVEPLNSGKLKHKKQSILGKWRNKSKQKGKLVNQNNSLRESSVGSANNLNFKIKDENNNNNMNENNQQNLINETKNKIEKENLDDNLVNGNEERNSNHKKEIILENNQLPITFSKKAIIQVVNEDYNFQLNKDPFLGSFLSPSEFEIFERFKKEIYYELQENSILNEDDTLSRFLYGTKGNIPEAKKAILKYFNWRKKNEVEKLISNLNQEIFTQVLKSNSVFLLTNHDKFNRPILVFKAKNFNPKIIPKQTLLNLIIQIMEIGILNILKIPNQAVTILIDLQECALSTIDTSLMKSLLVTFSDCYPGRLGVLFFVNTPWWMASVWNVLKKGLDKRQQKKIFFVRKQEKTHFEYIKKESLDNYYKCPNEMLNNLFLTLFPDKSKPFDENIIFELLPEDKNNLKEDTSSSNNNNEEKGNHQNYTLIISVTIIFLITLYFYF